MTRKLLAALAICILISLAAPAAEARAATSGITVSPAELNLTLQAAETSTSIPVTLSNSYPVPIRVTAEFKGIDVSRGLLIPTDKPEANLIDNLRISETDITIPAGGSTKVNVEVAKGPTLSPGGHYATLVFSQQSGSGATGNLRGSISVGMFIIRADGASPDIRLRNTELNGWVLAPPSNARLSFKNSGNVHAVPHGSVSVYTNSGSLLAQGIINERSSVLLPGKSFDTTVALSRLVGSWHPERLTINVQYRTGRGEGVDQQTFHRSYIPPVFILLCIGVVAVTSGMLYLLWRFRRKLIGLARKMRRSKA